MQTRWENIGRVIDSISRWTGWFAGILLIPLTIVVFYSAVMRKVTSNPDWAFEVSIFIYGTAIVLAGAEVLRKNEHVSVDILPRLLGEYPRKVLMIIITVFIIIVAIVIMGEGIQSAWQSTLIGERSSQQTTFRPPIWWFRWVFPIATALLILQSIRKLGDQIVYFNKDKEDLNAA